MSSPANPYITLTEAKEQLSIDDALTIHDNRIERLIGAAVDWAENFCGRSLGELLELNSPTDESAVPLPEPRDSPHFVAVPAEVGVIGIQGFNDWAYWNEKTWQAYWKNNPILANNAQPLRRDVKEAILMKIEQLFDRNTDNWELLESTSESMLFSYRIGMGV